MRRRRYRALPGANILRVVTLVLLIAAGTMFLLLMLRA